MTLSLHAVARTDAGLVRENNEDSAFAGRRFVAVADGVGGSPSGEVASRIVIETLAPLEQDDRHGADVLLAELAVANRRIREAIEAEPAIDGMGTTLTAVLLGPDDATLLHVGDSRAYLVRGGRLRQLTVDDTLVQAMVERGLLAPEEVRHHPHRSIITQAVQGREFTPTVIALTLEIGDRLLLCSDGLSDIVTDEALGEVLGGYTDAEAIADRLIKLALAAGAPDNVTVVVADVTGYAF
ncbi:protein phosphatase 2C domain-containing protein [Catellatospora sp. NPDC049133]|jgi:protein phosphatase|uniref:PP2C family protein-serine/threonine phosphatase n=1 Tax=Catellatospora sp. NPDC049133 TaxID=3155499 RepID=UPI0033E8D8D6